MRKLSNILFITNPDAKCSFSNDAIVVEADEIGKQRFPLHNIEGIVSFAFSAPTFRLMSECAKRSISFVSLSPSGNFLYRICGETSGNVNTRLSQYRFIMDTDNKLKISKIILCAKLKNCKTLLDSYSRRSEANNKDALKQASININRYIEDMSIFLDESKLRSIEGLAAKTYFSVFDEMISSTDPAMHFTHRSKRPPKDSINVLLSLAYTQLTQEYVHALENSGLDPYIGVFHGTRSGKPSMALDILEEMRPWADKFVLRVVNLGIIKSDMFEKINDEIKISRAGLKKFYSEYNAARSQEIYLDSESQKVERGIIPYIQARHLANYIIGTESEYHPFILKP